MRTLCVVLCACVLSAAFAQGGSTTVTPVKSYTGSVADVTKMQEAVSPITDEATLSVLWTDWGIVGPLPTVDFTKQLVVVSTGAGSDLQQNLTIDEKGNLIVGAISFTDQSVAGHSFRYVIAVISNAGITSVNGAPLPVPVPILRSASNTSFVPVYYPGPWGGTYQSVQGQTATWTITDEKTWTAIWGTDAKAPVTVDFTTEEALYVWMGYANVAISGVDETAQHITMSVTGATAGPAAYPGQTEPVSYAVAVIAKSDKPVYYNLGPAGTIVPIISTFTSDTQQKTAGTLVIKDVAAWKELYDKQMPAGTKLPEVNFGEDMAIVVFAGPPPETAAITRVTEAHGQLQVSYWAQQARAGMPDNGWYAVIVQKSDLPVTFTWVAGPQVIDI